MKVRFLLSSILLGAMAGVGYYAYNGGDAEAKYTPRSANSYAQGIHGAMEYYEMIRANVYTGQIEPEDVLRMRNAIQSLPPTKSNNLEWTSMGPDNIGGRTRALLIMPNNTELIAGGVAGGLYRSTNGGNSWSKITSFYDHFAVSSIARLGNGTIYVATGDSHESGNNGAGSSGFLGGGLFKSSDNGATWELAHPSFQPSPWNTNGPWSFINEIVADPNDPDKLWIGNNHGLFAYYDGDDALQPLPSGLPQNELCEDFKVSSDGEVIVASVDKKGFLSTDGGDTFTLLSGVFPSSANGRIEFAIAPSDPDYIYASIANAGSNLKGVFATIDRGQTWHQIALNDNNGTDENFSPFRGQGIYDNSLTVFPNDPGRIILGGIDMHSWEMVGNVPSLTSWEQISVWNVGGFNPLYVHADIHGFFWTHDGSALYITCDGGNFVAPTSSLVNNSPTYASRNYNYITSQIYGMAINADGKVAGGTQDNGSFYINFEGNTPLEGASVTGGDGFDCALSDINPNAIFTTLYYGNVIRSLNGGNSGQVDLGLLERSGANGISGDFFTDIRLWEKGYNEHSQMMFNFGINPLTPGFIEYEDPIFQDGDSISGYVPAGTEVFYNSPTTSAPFSQVLEQDLNFYIYRELEDTVIFEPFSDTIQFVDYSTAVLAAGLPEGVFVTRNPLDQNDNPEWFKVADTPSQVNDLEWSPDGDILYVAYANGSIQRISNFNNAWTYEQLDMDAPGDEFALDVTMIKGSGSPVLDIAVDYSQGTGQPGEPAASSTVIIAIGGYGGSGKVQRSPNAATSPGQASWQDIWNVPNEFLGMPCYAVEMDREDPDKIVVGTEYGIWSSVDGGASWAEANGGQMGRTPVFSLLQQKQAPWNAGNSGKIYAGTHGSGVFVSDNYFNQPSALDDFTKDPISDVLVVPNPVVDYAALQFDLGTASKVGARVFNINGQLIKNIPATNLQSGTNRLPLNASDLPNGTYIVSLELDGNHKVVKFVVSR